MLPDPDTAWSATETSWAAAVPALENCHTPPDAQHSYAVLRGLTSRAGGMVAAATTSLPERAEAGRNYDYRYVWIRDQCYAGQAVAAAGPHPLLDDAVRFVADRVLADGDQLAPAYTSTGDPVPDQHTLDLPGYPGGHNIVGNWVNKQFQLDALGESLLLFAAAARHDRMDTDSWHAARILAAGIAARWREPDAGIWEIDNRPWTHSRLICAAGLRAIARHAAGARPPPTGQPSPTKSSPTPPPPRCTPPVAGNAHPTTRRLDAALLLPALRGALPADDPRTIATLRRLPARPDRRRLRLPIPPRRTTAGRSRRIVHCSAGSSSRWPCTNKATAVEAPRWYERTRAACGPPGLFSEEYDAHQHQMRGNLPQAFVHALYLEAAARINPPHETDTGPRRHAR